MKTVKTIISVLFFLFVAQSLTAKSDVFKGDTIRYRFNKMLLEVTSPSFVNNGPDEIKLEERIKQVQKILAEMSIAKPAEDERVSILVREMGDDWSVWNYKELELKIEKKNSKNMTVFDDGTVFEKEFGQYCIFLTTREVNVKIYINDLAELASFSSSAFKTRMKEGEFAVTSEVGKDYRKSPVLACVDLREDEPKVHVQNSPYKSLDMLYLNGGVGSGWVKNTFVSDINFRLGLGFARKGMLKNIYAVEWSMMYDFSSSTENKFFELNHFVSLGWEHNFSNSPLKDKWYGFSAGYLVKRNNDFFKKNTFRVSVKKKVNDSISLKPELYFNDFLKNVYPGIRVLVDF